MKEAYTKALGLGMQVEFSSFETRLDGVDATPSIPKNVILEPKNVFNKK
jgi:hypothetical protein